jgi:hypothetical protein
MDKWDANDRNKHNDLGRYFQSLTRMQKELIKGIIKKPIAKLLTLNEEEFLKQLLDSLTLKEIGKLSDKELEYRGKLMDEVMAVWSSHKEKLEREKKNYKQSKEYEDEREDKCWMPRHHDLDPPEPEQGGNKKIHSVAEASRLHEGKDVIVVGVISGIQPLRKMIKGVSVQCLKLQHNL